MARSNFVKPDIVRIPLSDGDYLDVKRQLTAGEHRRIFARLVTSMTAGEKIQLDPEKVGLTKILEYVVGWGGPGFTDDAGTPVELSEGSVDLLCFEKYEEIRKAVDAHDDAQTAAREAEKNVKGGETKSVPISSSAA